MVSSQSERQFVPTMKEVDCPSQSYIALQVRDVAWINISNYYLFLSFWGLHKFDASLPHKSIQPFVYHSTANHALICVHPIAVCIYCNPKVIHVLHWLLILLTWLFITLDMPCSLSLNAYTTCLTSFHETQISYIIVLGERSWYCTIWNFYTWAYPHMRAFPSSSPQLSPLAVMINTEKQHIKLSGSLLFFSACIIRTATASDDSYGGRLDRRLR